MVVEFDVAGPKGEEGAEERGELGESWEKGWVLGVGKVVMDHFECGGLLGCVMGGGGGVPFLLVVEGC